MRGRGWPFSEDERFGAADEERDELMAEQDEADREADRLAERTPAKRAVMVEVPAGEGSPQAEFYRELLGLSCSHEIRIEETS